MIENRKFPRIPHVSSRQIIKLGQTKNEPQKSLVVTNNVSGCGVKFSTSNTFQNNELFLIYLNDLTAKDLQTNGKTLLKSGDYYMAQVVWIQNLPDGNQEVGAEFLTKKDGDADRMQTFTELLNMSMLDSLS